MNQPDANQPSPYEIVNNPASADWQLGQAASQAPELQPQIAAHPGASDNLLHWLTQQGTPQGQAAARQALANRGVGGGYGQGAPGASESLGTSGSVGGSAGAGYGPGAGPGFGDGAGAGPAPKKSKTGLIIGIIAGGTVVVLGLVIGGIFIFRGLFAAMDSDPVVEDDSSAAESTEVAPSDSGIPDSSGDVELETSQGETVSVPIEASGDGVLVGFADAPVTLDYYFDFSCPHCVDYHGAMGEAFQTGIADGDIQVRYHMINIVSEYGTLAGAATAATVQYEPKQFFTVMDALFAIPNSEQSSMDRTEYALAVEDAGVESADVYAVIEGGNYEDWILSSTDQALGDGVGGTPWLAQDGEQVSPLPNTLAELQSLASK
ncbi:DsbA family protein [Gulosibacter chungangensis]|uniref:Thioredoxin domain-containing protein n=1 Tax=Gulosibacter chungangensis TaxID=979746 RepID=A0A7J5BBV8_9MICO|nr:thioredoxin domain-containing protein [Gulosibacter chungangensis]KAB1642216.1 thioredoxin domain-containing protein [Gulosibacter chungangensis]